MRVWDVAPEKLCRAHLLGEHRELHGLWNILVFDKVGYSQHPETKRWVGKLGALYKRHEALVAEMHRRGYQHNSPLDATKATGLKIQEDMLQTIAEQEALLKDKPCECFAKLKA